MKFLVWKAQGMFKRLRAGFGKFAAGDRKLFGRRETTGEIMLRSLKRTADPGAARTQNGAAPPKAGPDKKQK